MPAKSRNLLERERDLRETAALYLHGLSQYEIAQRLRVSRQQIGYDLKLLQRRWQESALADFNAKKAAELAKMDELERTYWGGLGALLPGPRGHHPGKDPGGREPGRRSPAQSRRSQRTA